MARDGMSWYVSNTNAILDGLHIVFDSIFKVFLVLTSALAIVFFLVAIFSFFYRYKQKKFLFVRSKAPTVTIQIPTRNELAALNCAERCLNFDYPKEKIQILIGDDSNNKEISRKLRAFASKHARVQVIGRKVNSGFKPGNLNNMLKYTKGEIIVIFDSDFLPEKDFLKRLVSPFIHDKTLAASQARWLPVNKKKNFTTAMGFAITASFHHIFLPFMNKFSNSVCFCGSAEAVRTSVLKKHGEWKHGCLTEDIEYSMRLYKNGLRVEYLHDLTCGMEVPSRPVDLYKQQMRWAYGVIGSIQEHFWDITKAKVSNRLKTNVFWIAAGYMLTTLLLLLFSTGILSFFTHPPGPFDFGLFFFETIRNIAFTSGLLVTFALGMVLDKRWGDLPRLLVSTFTIGLIVTYYVNKGVYKVLSGGEMQWFLVKKEGNDV